MSESIWILIAAGIVVGIILLCVEYRTKWFARSPTSSNKKQSRVKSSPTEIKGRNRKILEFLSKRWWAGVGVFVIIILGILSLVIPGGLGRGVGCSQQIPQQMPQQSEEPSTEYVEHPSPEETSIEYREHPTPSEIKNEIGGLPPYQQDKAGDNYVGLKVQWHLKLLLTFTSDSDPNVIKIALTEDPSSFPTVWCNIDIREHPEIKTTDQYSGVFVKGEISRAKQFEIELINCTVKID